MINHTKKPMYINEQGILSTGEYYPSPHQDKRPDRDDISLIVLHNISLPPNIFGEQYVTDLFLGQLAEKQNEHPYFQDIAALKVSAHFLILRDGGVIQYVSTFDRAWHAGISCYQGREKCNDFSVGIELNGADHHPYTLRQYQTVAKLCRALMARHPLITSDRITTHSHIAPERKTDPGAAFCHSFFHRLLEKM